MNQTKLLSIMPYVLGVLILILMGVVILTRLGDDSGDVDKSQNTQQTSSNKNDKNKGEDTQKQDKNDVVNGESETKNDSDNSAPENNTSLSDNSESTSNEGTGSGAQGGSDSGNNAGGNDVAGVPTAAPSPTEAPKPDNGTSDLTYGFVFENKADYVDTKDGVNLRLGCSTDSDKVAHLENGMRLERTGYNSEWTRVIYNGQECYIATRLIIREVDSIDTVVDEPVADAGSVDIPEAGEAGTGAGAGSDNAGSDSAEAGDSGDVSTGAGSDGAGSDSAEAGDSDDVSTGTGAGSDNADSDSAEAGDSGDVGTGTGAGSDNAGSDSAEAGDTGDVNTGTDGSDNADSDGAETGDSDDVSTGTGAGSDGSNASDEAPAEVVDNSIGAAFTKVSYYGAGKGKTVCIDPGHQSKANNNTEPVGPGADEKKAKVSAGTTGVSTGLQEYKLNLTVSLKLKDELEVRGYKVIMTRTTHDVDLSNVDRAEIANNANVDAFIRVHVNAGSSSATEGIETICMTPSNPYNGELFEKSYALSKAILNDVVTRTGAKKRDIYMRDTYTGINWSKVPVSIVEMGYMTNSKEDQLLATDDYQNKIVVGIADGLDSYFSKVK